MALYLKRSAEPCAAKNTPLNRLSLRVKQISMVRWLFLKHVLCALMLEQCTQVLEVIYDQVEKILQRNKDIFVHELNTKVAKLAVFP